MCAHFGGIAGTAAEGGVGRDLRGSSISIITGEEDLDSSKDSRKIN